MKQLIIFTAIIFCVAANSSANPTFDDKKPSGRSHFNAEIKTQLTIIANPKTGDAMVSFTAAKNGKATIIVLDEAGNTVLKQVVSLAGGKNKINVSNFANLGEGYYTICLNTSHKAYSAPFLLWK
jgi:hypothetical protein